MESLSLSARCIHKKRMSPAQFPGEFVQFVVSNDGGARNVDHAVVRVELFDSGAPTDAITLPEYLLKVSIEKFNNWLGQFVPLSRTSN